MFRALTLAVAAAIAAPAFQANAQQGRPTGTWAAQGTGDCTGKDWASSDGALPEAAKCSSQTNGRVAVCWDGVNNKNPGRPGAWCTYKTVAPNECRGGSNPGVMYQCRATVVSAPPPAAAPPAAKPPAEPSAAPPPVAAAPGVQGAPGWVPRGFGDCTANDWASTSGLQVDAAKCTPQTAGRVAVCWNGVTYKNPSRAGAWCTYKTVPLVRCTGGSNPGYLFECRTDAASLLPPPGAQGPVAQAPGTQGTGTPPAGSAGSLPTSATPPAATGAAPPAGTAASPPSGGQPSVAQAPAAPPAGPATGSSVYDPPVASGVWGMPIKWDDCKSRVAAALTEHGFGNWLHFGNGWIGFKPGRSASVACVGTSGETVLVISTAGADVAGERDRLYASIRGSRPQAAVPPGNSAKAIDHRGENGKRFRYACAPGFTPNAVWGTNTYADDSDICSAAVHAGAITVAAGGSVVIEIRAGQASYAGSTRNGVSTLNYGNWPGSFVVIERQ